VDSDNTGVGVSITGVAVGLGVAVTVARPYSTGDAEAVGVMVALGAGDDTTAVDVAVALGAGGDAMVVGDAMGAGAAVTFAATDADGCAVQAGSARFQMIITGKQRARIASMRTSNQILSPG
jgi:hypothetical protein